MSRNSSSDLPAAAYDKALAAAGDLDEAARAYERVLETARALIDTGRLDDAVGLLARNGEQLAGAAAAAGRRLAPAREAVESGAYSGPHARELTRRVGAARIHVGAVARAAAVLTALCAARRDGAAVELAAATQSNGQGSRRVAAAYSAGPARLAVDVSG